MLPFQKYIMETTVSAKTQKRLLARLIIEISQITLLKPQLIPITLLRRVVERLTWTRKKSVDTLMESSQNSDHKQHSTTRQPPNNNPSNHAAILIQKLKTAYKQSDTFSSGNIVVSTVKMCSYATSYYHIIKT